MFADTAVACVTVHALSKAWTCNDAFGDSNALTRRQTPYNSGFSRKSREKRLEFRAGLYCNSPALIAFSHFKCNDACLSLQSAAMPVTCPL